MIHPNLIVSVGVTVRKWPNDLNFCGLWPMETSTGGWRRMLDNMIESLESRLALRGMVMRFYHVDIAIEALTIPPERKDWVRAYLQQEPEDSPARFREGAYSTDKERWMTLEQ